MGPPLHDRWVKQTGEHQSVTDHMSEHVYLSAASEGGIIRGRIALIQKAGHALEVQDKNA